MINLREDCRTNKTMDLDDSSDSDEDFYKEIGIHEDSSPERLETTNIDRIIHKTTKSSKTLREKAVNKGSKTLPSNLLMKVATGKKCPNKALLCLTPGVGYLPVVEHSPKKFVILDPADRSLEHQFCDHFMASRWLNEFFMDRLTFSEKFEMEWVIMKGSIIRKLQRLNPDLFRFLPRQLEITPMGLESPLNVRQELRNQLERERRLEITRLVEDLGREVLPIHKPEKPSNQLIMTRAVFMVEAQSLIAVELSEKSLELTRRKSFLDDKLRSILAELVDPVERKKALKICRFIKRRYKRPLVVKEPDSMDMKTMKLIEDLNNGLFSSQNSTNKKTVAKEPDLMDMKTKEMKLIEDLNNGLFSSQNSTNKKTCDEGKQQSLLKSAEELKRLRDKVQCIEGRLIKKKRPAEKTKIKEFVISEVVNLIDSDEETEKKVIEIESDEDDVVWLPNKTLDTEEDHEVEILSCNVRRKRPKLIFPKPKKSLPPPMHEPTIITTDFGGDIRDTSTASKDSSEYNHTVVRSVESSECQEKEVSPVAMVVSQSLMDELISTADEKKLSEQQTWVSAPEFVSVSEDAYEPVISSDSTESMADSCSRTQQVPVNIRTRVYPKFLPMTETTRVNILSTPSSTFTNERKPILPIPSSIKTVPPISTSTGIKINNPSQIMNKSQVLDCKNITPIGKINPDSKFCNMRGKSILLFKSESGFKIKKIPPTATQPSRVTPLRSFPEACASTSPDRANTLTLYHPSEEISETRTVQFANTNSVHAESPSGLSGPKIRKPRETSHPNIKVLLPKRN